MCISPSHENKTFDRILSLIEKCPEGIKPKTVAKCLHLNESTVRSYMRRLFSRGLLVQNYNFGFYTVAKTIHGITNYNIHNIYLSYTFNEETIKESGQKKIRFQNIKIRIYYGMKSRKATCSVSSKNPLSLRELELVKYVFENEVKRELKKESLPELYVKSAEINRDYNNIRMEGLNAVTWNNFAGLLEKYYNKKEGVRKEFKASVPVKASVLLSVLRNNIDIYPLIERVGEIEKDVKIIKEYLRRNLI